MEWLRKLSNPIEAIKGSLNISYTKGLPPEALIGAATQIGDRILEHLERKQPKKGLERFLELMAVYRVSDDPEESKLFEKMFGKYSIIVNLATSKVQYNYLSPDEVKACYSLVLKPKNGKIEIYAAVYGDPEALSLPEAKYFNGGNFKIHKLKTEGESTPVLVGIKKLGAIDTNRHKDTDSMLKDALNIATSYLKFLGFEREEK